MAQNGVIEDLQDQIESLPGTVAKSFASAQPTTIDIGGSFATRATVLGTLELEPGKYVINGFGFFDSIAAYSHGRRRAAAAGAPRPRRARQRVRRRLRHLLHRSVRRDGRS